MMEVGLLRNCGQGTFYILPLLQRSVEKLTKILDRYMKEIDGQRVTLPTLTPSDLWKKSGRLEDATAELMIVKDRHDKVHLLSPVCDHEYLSPS
jgi:prolyl-tRNA synthetase